MGNNSFSTAKLKGLLALMLLSLPPSPPQFQQIKPHSSYQRLIPHMCSGSQFFTPSFSYQSLFSSLEPNFLKGWPTFSFCIYFLTSHLVLSSFPDLCDPMPTKLLSQATNNQRQLVLAKLEPKGPSLA